MKSADILWKYFFLLLLLLSGFSCAKEPTDYRSFLNGHEIVYPGAVANPVAKPGNNRLLLTWHPGTDPSIMKYIVYWNGENDSVIVNAATHNTADTVKAPINGLDEASYTFVIYSFDDKGNISIPTRMENVKVFGEQYQSTLLNRAVAEMNYSGGMLTVKWNTPDTINITTAVRYTDTLNQAKTVYLSPDSSTLTLADWKLPTKIYYRSSYIPQANAIDTFRVSHEDSLIATNLPVEKTSWKAAPLPKDAVVDAYGTSLSNIWDGQPGAYPEVYHSDGADIPHTFTIDLGKTYKQLTRFEEWGRTDFDGHNPDDFEVWGIADTTGAVPALPSSDPGWKNASIAKGWTLLTEVKRDDDGIAGIETDLISDPPPVRFIRIRVLHCVDDDKFSHMSEISFWYNP